MIRQKFKTHRGQDGDEVALSLLIVQRTIDRDLALMRQVDAEVTVPVGGGDPVAPDTLVAADHAAVAGRDRVLDDAVDAGVGVDCHDVLEDGRADRGELRARCNGEIISNIIYPRHRGGSIARYALGSHGFPCFQLR